MPIPFARSFARHRWAAAQQWTLPAVPIPLARGRTKHSAVNLVSQRLRASIEGVPCNVRSTCGEPSPLTEGAASELRPSTTRLHQIAFHRPRLQESYRLASEKTKRRKQMPKATAAAPAKTQERVSSEIPTDLSPAGVAEISAELRKLLADTFALYMKTKNFHWHMTGPHFRDYHLLLDEHAEQIFAMTDDIAERARKIGATTLRSIGDISKHQRLKDNNDECLGPEEMLAELRTDNSELTRFLRATHEICEKHNDVATASLIEVWIDQTERRTWFLAETAREV